MKLIVSILVLISVSTPSHAAEGCSAEAKSIMSKIWNKGSPIKFDEEDSTHLSRKFYPAGELPSKLANLKAVSQNDAKKIPHRESTSYKLTEAPNSNPAIHALAAQEYRYEKKTNEIVKTGIIKEKSIEGNYRYYRSNDFTAKLDDSCRISSFSYARPEAVTVDAQDCRNISNIKLVEIAYLKGTHIQDTTQPTGEKRLNGDVISYFKKNKNKEIDTVSASNIRIMCHTSSKKDVLSSLSTPSSDRKISSSISDEGPSRGHRDTRAEGARALKN